jgi:hypothetical protein
VDLLHDDTDPAQRTFLFPSPPGAKIEVESTVAAVVTVARPHFVRRVLPTRVPQD